MKEQEEFDAEKVMNELKDIGGFAKWFQKYKKEYPSISENKLRVLYDKGERRELYK